MGIIAGHTPLPEGVTYRKLMYWVAQGLFPEEADDLKPGPGVRRELTSFEWDMLSYMVRLRAAGLENRLAARMARAFANGPILISAATETFMDIDDFEWILTSIKDHADR